MSTTIHIETSGYQQWIRDERCLWPEIPHENCCADRLRKALSPLGAELLSCELNVSGRFDTAGEDMLLAFPGTVYEGLPEYYDIRIRHKTGQHSEYIVLWMPVRWNGRYLATGGGGFRSDNCWGADLPNMRIASIPLALRNGFVGSTTNGGVDDTQNTDWVLDDSGRVDEELVRNFSYASIHSMAVISKAVITAVYGHAPEYSYMQGASTGGLQSLEEAQHYPEDFDGIWGDCPAINFTRFVPAELWPSVVENEFKTILRPAKLEAFRSAVIEKCGGWNKYYSSLEKPVYDAAELVGVRTADGTITENDAKVMQMIWDGPRDADGSFLWYGLWPGAEAWLNPLCPLYDNGDEIIPFSIAEIFIKKWLLKDPDWNWKTMKTADFGSVMRQSVNEYPEVAGDNADLSGLRDSGHKLIITHGLNDECIFPMGTIEYYGRAAEAAGGKAELKKYARLFLFPGNGHGFSKYAPGFTIADGMAALIDWVENGREPENVPGRLIDQQTYEEIEKTVFCTY